MSWMLLLAEALAAGPDLQDEGVSVVVRGIGESWDEPTLTEDYVPGALLGGVGVVVPLHAMVVLDLEFAAGRWKGSPVDCPGTCESTLTLKPVSLVVEARMPLERGYAFAGAGLSLAVFNESAPTKVTLGQIGSVDLRGGLRWDLGLELDRTKGTFLELYGGRRMQRDEYGIVDGYDLAAWRGSLGVGFTF